MTGLYHGWDHEDDTHADFRHGAVDIDDFNDTVRYRKKRKYKKKPKAGCPGNDGGPHVYVWIPYSAWDGSTKNYSLYRWYINYEVSVCCGCNKRRGSKGFRSKRN